jgi:rare lipoprotein A
VAVGDLDRQAATMRGPGTSRPRVAADAKAAPAAASAAVAASPPDTPEAGVDTGVMATTQSPTITPGVDLGAAAAVDAVAVAPGSVTTVSESVATTSLPSPAVTPARVEKPDERARADTTAGIGWWIQLGAFKQRDGALDFQRRLIDEQPWLGPLLAVFSDRGLNKLQAGPYVTRDDARSAADKIRSALQLVPTIVEKR